jgi:hypothetical protein
MNFLNPSFLFALFATLIPVIIHLFSFRRYKTVYFSNVNYLKNIKNEAQRKSRLKNLILLILRILAIAGLVFAFAQPYLPHSKFNAQNPNPVVSVYIDNSFSMNAVSTEGQLLEVARRKALEIANTYSPGTRFLLVTNDMLPQHQHLFNRDQLVQQVSEIKSSPKTMTLSLIHNRLADYLAGNPDVPALTAFYLSDFQTKICDFQKFTHDSTIANYLIPLSTHISTNLYIDSCWMEYPAHKIGEEETLQVLIKNRSDQSFQNLPLKFYLNDTLKALSNFNIDANGEKIVELKYRNLLSGLHLGVAEISDFPIVHDNSYYLSYNVQPNLKALAIYDSNLRTENGLSYLSALFKGDNYISLEISELKNLKVSRLDEFNTIFLLNIGKLSSGLINELKMKVNNGTTVIFFPELNGDIETYNNFLALLNANKISRVDTSKQVIAAIDWEHPVYEKVFKDRSTGINFPVIKGYFVFSEDIRIPETRLMWFRNKEKAVSTQKAGNGNLVVFSFPLSPVNDAFARDILFVPTIYSLVINSLPQQKIASILGRDVNASIADRALPDVTALSVLEKSTGQEFIPEVMSSEGGHVNIDLTKYFNLAGQYLVRENDHAFTAISLNYDRMESDLNFMQPEELISAIEKSDHKNIFILQDQERNFGEVFKEIQSGTVLWRWFVGFVILCLLAEAIIIRFWK